MIGRLTGIILEKQPPYLLLDVQGVAYELQAPMTSFYPLADVGEQAVLHTHLAVSETSQQLFAFYTADERRLFRTLIKVNGIGPRMALAILSGMSVSEFVSCVRAGHTAVLIKVPGVGKKTAARLIIEVKDRLQDWDETSNDHSVSNITPVSPSPSVITADAESALISLGYKPSEAVKVIAQITRDAEPSNSEELIRLSLQHMGGR
ncbi:MAG: Holliday junction branch migration protein RuvA [Cellvibrionaceae bacterium]|nr:Holliday junction branch migration protein RuvA [Cellvibrionaceae bacterium]